MTNNVEFSLTEPCGCGSGRNYGECCKSWMVQYVRNRRKQVFRTVALVPEAVETLRQVEEEFRKAFGRKPQDRDKMFAQMTYRHSSEDINQIFERAALEADIRKELIYAHRKLDGLMLTEETFELASPDDQRAWIDAIEEYQAAAAEGVDLLLDHSRTAEILQEVSTILEIAVVHLGSYADRPPKNTKKDTALFFQFLLTAKCHRLLKVLADRWDNLTDEEVFSLLRGFYECTLVIGRLEADPTYAESLVGQALAGSEIYPFRVKKNGEVDYSTVVDVKHARNLPARTSYLQSAKIMGPSAIAFFELAYPVLSSGVHFNTLRLLQDYMGIGHFLDWSYRSRENQALILLVMLQYFLTVFVNIDGLPKMVKRDSRYLLKRLRTKMVEVVDVLDDEGRSIDQAISIMAFAAVTGFTPSLEAAGA